MLAFWSLACACKTNGAPSATAKGGHADSFFDISRLLLSSCLYSSNAIAHNLRSHCTRTLSPSLVQLVIGATFEKQLLLHMLPSNRKNKSENLHTALLKLIEANFISRSVVGQTERFSFVHTSVQEVTLCQGVHEQARSRALLYIACPSKLLHVVFLRCAIFGVGYNVNVLGLRTCRWYSFARCSKCECNADGIVSYACFLYFTSAV